jgi:peptide/nickel transport system permease protein
MKTVSLLLTVLFVLSIIFTIVMVIPEDPYRCFFVTPMSSETGNDIIREMRLNDPLIVQYIDYVRDSLVGDFRLTTSYQTGSEVEDLIWGSVPATVLLFTTTIVLSILSALSLEYFASSRRSKFARWSVHILAIVSFSIPAMWYSLWLIISSNDIGIDLPVYVHGNGFDAVGSDGIMGIPTLLSHLALPLTAAFISTFGLFVLSFRWANERRMARGSQENGEGFRKWTVSVFHELTGMRPFVYFLVACTFCAVAAVDSMYGYLGLGDLFWTGIHHSDMPLTMALMFVSSLFVLVAGAVLNTVFNLASRRSLNLALSDWVKRDEAFEGPTTAGKGKGVTLPQWMAIMTRRCLRSWAFTGALIVLLAVIASAALAPILATVPDPQLVTSREPMRLGDDWINPLPPSLDVSPYTDYLHPLGTDMMGKDVYSTLLYGARPAAIIAVALVAGTVLIGLAAGVIPFFFPEPDVFPKVLRDLFDFGLTILARAYVTLPLIILLIVWGIVARLNVERDFSMLSTIPMLLVGVYSWAWIMTCRPVRAMKRMLGPEARLGNAVPGILAESLSIAKFVVPIGFLIEMTLSEFFYNPGMDTTWYVMIVDATNAGTWLFDDTYWHLLYVPVSAILLVCASLFVLLDRAEHALRTSEVHPERRSTAVHEEASPSG